MSFEDNDVFATGLVLHIDADTIAYGQCCVNNEDDDIDRGIIAKGMRRKMNSLMVAAGCDSYVCFLTTKTNFRDDLVDDYKGNRANVERPVNLNWAKNYLVKNFDCMFQDKLEADDLLGIESGPGTVIWSIDKDLRQVPGLHLDDNTGQVIEITEEGTLKDLGKKIYFDGLAGFYFQCLTGDTTDNIVGCGKRVMAEYKSGAKAGETYWKRQGVGPKNALKILQDAEDSMLDAVIHEYKELHGEDWQVNLETQANLLFMVREKHGVIIRRWTYDDREEYFDLIKGEILDGYHPEAAGRK